MSRTKQSARRFVFGIGTLGLILVVLYVAFTANQARLPWDQPTNVKALFDDVGQLQVGSEVRQNGLRVGQVTKIDFIDGKPLVTMGVSNIQPMYRDGYAGIWDQSSLALKFIELRSGNPATGPLGDAPLPVAQTESTHDVVQVLDVFDPTTRGALGNSLRQLGGMAGYGPGLHDFTATLPQSLDNIRKVSTTLVDKRTDLPGLLAAIDRPMTRFAGREQIIGSLLRQTDTTLRAIAVDGGKPLGDTLTKLPGALETLRGTLEVTNPPLADLAVATTNLRSGAGSLGRATPDVRAVFRDGPKPLGDVPDFSDGAKPAVVNLENTFSDLKPFVPRLSEGVEKLVKPLGVLKPYGVDVSQFNASFDSAISEHIGWRHGFRGQLVMPDGQAIEQSPIKYQTTPYPAPRQQTSIRSGLGGAIPFDPNKQSPEKFASNKQSPQKAGNR